MQLQKVKSLTNTSRKEPPIIPHHMFQERQQKRKIAIAHQNKKILTKIRSILVNKSPHFNDLGQANSNVPSYGFRAQLKK
jgi:hypothetical protein